MNTNRVYIGNIMHGDKIVLKNTFLIKCNNEFFVELSKIKNILDLHKANNYKLNTLVYFATPNNGYYVDEKSLNLYYKEEKQKSLKKIKQDIILDPRNSIGLDH